MPARAIQVMDISNLQKNKLSLFSLGQCHITTTTLLIFSLSIIIFLFKKFHWNGEFKKFESHTKILYKIIILKALKLTPIINNWNFIVDRGGFLGMFHMGIFKKTKNSVYLGQKMFGRIQEANCLALKLREKIFILILLLRSWISALPIENINVARVR